MTMDLDGEYWLDKDGWSTYADGDADVASPNHEAVVLLHIAGVMKGQLDPLLAQRKWQGLDAVFSSHYIADEDAIDPVGLRCALLDWADAAQKAGQLTEDEADDIEETLVQAAGLDRQAVKVLFGRDNAEEARDYGRRVLGWTRVSGRHLDTYGISPEKLAKIAEGLHEAFGNDVFAAEFALDDWQACKYYDFVPYSVLLGGKLMELQGYLRRQATPVTPS